MARIGLIQISDTQFGPKHAFPSGSAFAKKIVDDVLTCADKFAFVPSYVIVSGDIAETGTANQFDDALEVFRQIAGGLSIDRPNVLFVPGNHDVNRALAELGPEIGDSRLKLQCYDRFCFKFYGDHRNFDENIFQVVTDHRLGIAFLLINSCEKEDHETHIGSVCEDKLLRTLELPELKYGREHQYLAVAVLHHRVDTDGGEEKSRVDNADEVAAILREHGVQLTLTGHIHSQLMNATTSDGKTMIFSGCGSSGVDKSQRPDGVANQYSIHIADNTPYATKLHTYFRAYNPRRTTKYGLGGWTIDTTYENESQTYDLNWSSNRQISSNQFIEDAGLSQVLGISKNPFTISNAEKFSNDVILQLFVQDEERHRAALRLSGDAIIRGSRGSGKTMCLRYLSAIGLMGFHKSMTDRKTAECFPVLVNLGQLHVSDRADISTVYEAAESLIVQQTLSALDAAVIQLQSPQFKAAVSRVNQQFNISRNQAGSAISHLGTAITAHLSSYFNHVLLLIDEIAPVFPRVFFTNPDDGFGKWMNAIRNSGPYNTRITVYPNDVSDTLNEERFGSIVNLNFDPRVPEDLAGFREYAIKLFNVYVKAVATTDQPPTINEVIFCEAGADDTLEQILYATGGSSRRLMRLFEKTLTLRCRSGRVEGPLRKADVFELITEYSVALVSSYSSMEQQLAASIAKACKKASTFRFRLPHLSDSMKRLCLSREETNIVSIIELGTGTRATAYEFNYPYCIQMGISTHHVKETARINQGRDCATGDWIHKITGLKKEDLEVFQDEERTSGVVTEVVDEMVLIRDDAEREFYAMDPDLDLVGGEAVSFVSVDNLAEDLLLIE